jgi:NOL1/NOP2/fmu family ribosome biogenesis protein
MAQHLRILNSKEIKEVHEKLRDQFGFTGKVGAAMLLSEKKEKVYLFTQDLAGVDISRLRIDTMGLYFASFFGGLIRLSIDGSQIVGPRCTKNILDITKEEMQTWLRGEKLALSELSRRPDETPTGFVLVRYGGDYLGCGKIAGDLVLNYIPKTRYIHATYDDVEE